MNITNSRSRRPSFTNMSAADLFALAQHLVRDERLFLDPYLTLEVLAHEMNVRRNALSAAVNQYAGMIFPVWIANYRIAEVERLAAMPENRRTSIAKLAMQAGFTNRTSFYRVYKVIKNGKPSETLRTITK